MPDLLSVRRGLSASAAMLGALVIAAPSAFANDESIRFDFDPAEPNAVHQWAVPTGVTEIEVEAAGGGGGAGREAGGRGALVQADVAVEDGTTFTIGVGGGGGRNDHAGGGGGASIVHSDDVLVIAGGGGGGSSLSARPGGDAAHNLINGAGQSGGGGTGAFGGGDRGRKGTGGSGGTARGLAGEDFDTVNRTGGAGGEGAQVGGAGGEGRSSGGGGGGAGYGGGQAGGVLGGGGAGGSTAQGTGVNMVEGSASYYSQDGGTAGVRTFGGFASTAGGHGWVIIRWTAPPPRPPELDPTPEPEPAIQPAPPAGFTLAMPADMTCAPLEGMTLGAWVRLPSAAECSTASNERVGAGTQLLGWATTPDFPTDIAQRQVDNGWGAHEIADENGSLQAVFIPAGGWTQASSDTTMFPIWGQVRG